MKQSTSKSTSQSVRFGKELIQIQAVVIDDVICLRLEDVQRRFPSATALCIDNEQLLFLCDKNGKNLEPLRIEACPDKVVEAVAPIAQSNNSFIIKRLNSLRIGVEHVQEIAERTLANSQEILNQLQHVMTQMYELHEYTTPRYFFILPAKHYDSALANSVKNLFYLHFKLYFLCECSDKPDELHVAPHEGYSIKKPQEFIVKYGSYLQTTLSVARAILIVGGFIIPQLGTVSTVVSNRMVPVSRKLDRMELTDTLKSVEIVISTELADTKPWAVTTKKSDRIPLQGAQLRELESYLERVDNKNSLGNLIRTTTPDGHVRWVCLEHYNSISHHRIMSDHIRQFEAFGGKFDEKTNEAVLTGINLRSNNVDKLCDALMKGFNMLSLTLERCVITENNLNKLFDIVINRSSVRHLVMSNTTIKDGTWLLTSEYICGFMSVQINNKSLNIRFIERFQDGDMKLLVQLWSQNKICRTLDLFGGNFNKYGKYLYSCLKTKQESITLALTYVNNIEFLYDILNYQTSLNHLKLSFWLSSPPILSRFCEILGNNTTLTELSIMDHHCLDDTDFTNELLTTLRGHKSIKRLTLHVYHVNPKSRKEACLVNALFYDSFITRLLISESIIFDEFVEALIYASQKVNSLTHLEFYDCEIDKYLISKLQLLHTSELLTHLTFSKEQYGFMAVANMRQQLQEETADYKNKKIEQIIAKTEQNSSKIHFYRQELNDWDIELIIKEAINEKQCIELYLGSNKFTSIGISILADALNNNNQKLEILWLYDNQVCDDGIYFLAKILSTNNTTLKKLDIGKTNMTDEGVKHLAQMLKINKTLTDLFLNDNEITDDGVRILTDAIQNHNTTIQSLYISGNKLLTDISVDYLVQMIKYNQSLKLLRVYDCNLTVKGKERLIASQKSKKNFKIQVNKNG